MSQNIPNQSRATFPNLVNTTLPSVGSIPQRETSEIIQIKEQIQSLIPEDDHIVLLVKTDSRIGFVLEVNHDRILGSNQLKPEIQHALQSQFPEYQIDCYFYTQDKQGGFTSFLHSRLHALHTFKTSNNHCAEYVTASKIGEILWGGQSKSAIANSILLDYAVGTLTVFEERVSNSSSRLNRAVVKYNALISENAKELVEQNGMPLSINVEIDSSMHDLRSQLKEFLKDFKISQFSIVNEPQYLVVQVVHDSSDDRECEKERSKIRSLVQGMTPGAIKVEGITGGLEQVEKIFTLLPPDWRLSDVSVSTDGKAARLTSNTHSVRTWTDDVDRSLNTMFPCGVFLNKESFAEVTSSDPQYAKTLHLLPTRCELRSMRRCVVTGELELTLVQLPDESTVAQLRLELSTEVNFVTIPSLFAPYPIQEPVRFIGQYAGKIPFITVAPEYLSTLHGRGGCLSIGGSCFSIRVAGLHFVADFGAHLQEGEKLELTEDITQNSAFGVVTHLHTDHSGALIEAYMQGYRKPILMTKTIAVAMYPILREQAMRKNIHSDVIEDIYKLVVIVPCDIPLRVSENHTLTFYHSGHSLGSTSIRVEFNSESESFSVLYTGDYKNGLSRLYNPAVIPPPSDVVISEGTYGMKEVPSLTEVSQQGLEAIKSAVLAGSTVICPLLSFDRAQEVLMMLDPHREWFESHDIPIHIVGGIIEKNLIYGYVAKDQPHVLSELAHKTKPWRFCQHSSISKPGNSDYSQELLARGKGKLILVSGGMVVGHAEALIRRYQDDPSALLLLTCYQAEGTLGREILDHAEGRIQSIESLPDSCFMVKRVSLGGHSSGEQTLDYLSKTVKENGTIVLVHGTEESLQEIKDSCIKRGIGGEVLMLKFGVTTPLGDSPNL